MAESVTRRGVQVCLLEVCACPPGVQTDEPCPSLVRRPSRLVARLEHLPETLARYCAACEECPDWVKTGQDLRRARPGATDPVGRCDGCVFAAVGELEVDRSLGAVLDPRAWGPRGRRCDA